MFADARTPPSRLVQASAMPVSPTRSIIAPVAPSSRTDGVDDGLQDLVLVVGRADPAGDLAQRPLGVGGPGQLAARASELLDESGVGDRDGGLAGEGPDQARVGLGEGRPLLRVDLDDAERPAVAGDRRGDHRVEAGPLVELGRLGRGREAATRGRRRPG